MRFLFKLILIFLILTLVTLVATRYFGFELQDRNYWDHHGVFFLLFLALFPRLTLLFSSVASGGIIWWLAWIFAPRILVATLATLAFWNQNPVLVALSWLVAVGGEASEKVVVIRQSHYRHRPRPSMSQGEIIDVTPR